MLRQVVESQIIKSIGYDHGASVLEVEFRNGWIYEYDEVPASVYVELMAAPSHGHFLKRRVVDKFHTRRTR